MPERCMLLLALLLANAVPGLAQSKNGFDLSGSLVPEDEILSGGPPRDGIPALVDPAFEKAGDVDWLEGDDRADGEPVVPRSAARRSRARCAVSGSR